MSNYNTSLAIIIPAYKAAFLKDTLLSLAAQVDSLARIYVFDDASPEDIRSVMDEFGDQVVYRRFETNLGGSDLAGHWNRCIDATDEDWIWLFSDDDVADPGCLAAFREQDTSVCLYRFDTKVIDAEGNVVEFNVPHPEMENSLDYAYYRFNRKRSTTAVEYIFLRDEYERVGKFDSFPLAWGSDVVMWIKLAETAGIRTLRGPVIGWRRSELNLSPDTGRNVTEKISGSVMFFEWTRKYFENRYMDNPKHSLLLDSLDAWISNYILNQSAYLPLIRGIQVLKKHMIFLRTGSFGKSLGIMMMKKVSKTMKRILG